MIHCAPELTTLRCNTRSIAQVKGQRTVLEILRQLSNELNLPDGSEHRLRLLGMGNGEINAVIDRGDDAHRVSGVSIFARRYPPFIYPSVVGGILSL